jgi:hypothetical protein
MQRLAGNFPIDDPLLRAPFDVRPICERSRIACRYHRRGGNLVVRVAVLVLIPATTTALVAAGRDGSGSGNNGATFSFRKNAVHALCMVSLGAYWRGCARKGELG